MKGPKKKECLVVATLINENVQMAERKNISIHSGNIEDLLCAVSEMNKIDKILLSSSLISSSRRKTKIIKT